MRVVVNIIIGTGVLFAIGVAFGLCWLGATLIKAVAT